MILKQMKSHTKTFLFTILDKDNQRFGIHKKNSVNLLYLIINKINGYFEEINGNKYLMLFLLMRAKKLGQ